MIRIIKSMIYGFIVLITVPVIYLLIKYEDLKEYCREQGVIK